MRAADVRFAILGVLGVLAGCGGLSFEDFERERRDAYCGYLVRCGAISTVADCREAFERTAIDSPSLAAAIDADKVAYDDGAAEACIDAYGSLSCDTTAQPDDAFAACDAVFTGTLANGAACGFDLECESSRCAAPDCPGACCTGTCAPAAPLPSIGEPCTSLCAGDAYCDVDSICRAALPIGAACTENTLCVRQAYCEAGTCTQLPHSGDLCASGCAEVGSLCIDGRCRDAGMPGDPCSSDAACSRYYWCDFTNHCAELPALGMPCTGACAGGAYCDAMLCVAQKSDGADCIYNDECASHLCDDGACTTPAVCI